jgi:peroxiredoxin
MKTNLTTATTHPSFSLNSTADAPTEKAPKRLLRRFLYIGGAIVSLILILIILFLLLTNVWWTGLPTNQLAPNFTGQDLQGNRVQLSDYRGRPVMVTFWSPDCFACRDELPALQAIAQNPDSNIVLLTVVTHPTAAEVKDFVKKQGLTFPVLMDEQSTITTQYKVHGEPFTYFISPDGRVEQKVIGAGAPGELHNNLLSWLKTCNVNTVCR